MKIEFRIDDFPGTKPSEFDRHNLENFKLFDAVMAKHTFGYGLACIPKYFTQEHQEYFRGHPRASLWLHGVDHPESRQNEFEPWRTEAEVVSALEGGRAVLSPLDPSAITTYVPPHNVIDPRTVNALVKLGFTRFLGGPGTDRDAYLYAVSHGLSASDLQSPPFDYGRTDEMMQRGALASYARLSARDDERDEDSELIIALHWPWELNVGLNNLDVFLGRLRGIMKKDTYA